MSSEKENSELQNSNQEEQPEVPVSGAEAKSDKSSPTEVPKEPEVELTEEEKLHKRPMIRSDLGQMLNCLLLRPRNVF